MKEKQKTILDRGWDKFTTKHKTKDGKAIDVLIKSKKNKGSGNESPLYKYKYQRRKK